MNRFCSAFFTLIALLSSTVGIRPVSGQDDVPHYVMVVHGGAGTILRENLSDETERAYRAKLEEALQAGYTILNDGGASLDAVVAAIQIMEESDLFNAGVGAVFTSEGTVEHDASIMDGRTRQAGAVAGLKHVWSPIALARLVMEKSPHVMMTGAGAESFAREHGIEMVDNEVFFTERRRRQLERAREDAKPGGGDARLVPEDREADAHRFGTVGAVAVDHDGNLAAATSTGGTTNKRFGRVGDSPIIGAGTYADNQTAAISSTGVGEYFIRGVIAHDIAAMIRYTGLSLSEAASAVIMGKLTEMGGTGGVIAIDRRGNVAMPFNTPGMYRGRIDADGNVTIEIYRD